MTLGYPNAPRHINHRDTFTTLLIRQGPQQRTPSNIPSNPSPAPSLSLSWSQGTRRAWWGRPSSERGWKGVCVCVCERVCEVRPPHSEASPGTTAGTRLLLGLSTVAPQEQQKTPPNAPRSSSVNTQKQAHKHTTCTNSPQLTHSTLIVFSVTCVCIVRTFAGQKDGKEQ